MFLVYWDNVLVGMASCITMPCGTLKYAWRQHRLVILPDYQGLGFGTRINDFLAEYFVSRGYKYFIRTTHVRLINHLSNQSTWKSTSTNKRIRSNGDIGKNIQKQKDGLAHTGIIGDTRIAGSFEYLGIDATKPEKIIVVENVDNIEKFTQDIIALKKKYYVKVVTGIPIEDNDIEIAMKKIGVRTEQLYYRKGDNLVMNGKYKKYYSK